MAQEAYNIQRASDGKTLRGKGGEPYEFDERGTWQNSDLNTNFRLTVDASKSIKQEFQNISWFIDLFPQDGEIYRLNPVFIQ
jgi:hypothetical protein